MQKLQWTRNGRRFTLFWPGSWERSISEKEVILEAQRDEKKVHFATLMDICHLQECRVRTPISHVYGSSRAPRRHCEVDSLFTEQGLSVSQMTAAKSNGCHCKSTRLTDKQPNAISADTREKWRTLQECSEFRSQNV